jgi:DNA-directed RNA polymerase subunit RPC12/RpoP
MIVFPCQTCQTPLSAEDHQAGQLVRCPTCSATLKVPHRQPQQQYQTVGAGSGGGRGGGGAGGTVFPTPPPSNQAFNRMTGFRATGGGKRYGFNCGYCSSRLEATESMGAQEGQCPTCGNNITIPILDRYGRLIDPKTRQIIKQDPHPVHAYAAAGDRAPKILRRPDGSQTIQCPRCSAMSPITANNCKSCGMPFTMEGTTLEAAGTSNGFCVASLVLGIIGMPLFCTGITPVLAIVFGIIGFNQVSKAGGSGGKGMAIAGMICGAVGTVIAVMFYLR